MRVTSIEARELFSFDTFRITDLPQTLVVVGPNGAGKTNLLRLLEVGIAGVNRAALYSNDAYQQLARFARSRRVGAAPASVSIARLGIAFTEPWERELLTGFIRATIASGLLQGTPTNADVSDSIGWIRAQITDALVTPVASGAVVVEFADTPLGPWTVSYEFEAGGQKYRWMLDGGHARGALMRAADARRLNVPALSLAQKIAVDERRVPTQPLTLTDLLPPEGEARALTLEAGPQWAELTREFAALAGIPVDETQQQSYSLARVLQVVLSRGLVLLGDLRQPPRTDYTVGEVSLNPPPTDGSSTPVQLFRLKNGSSADRDQYSEVQALFRRLTGRSFEVALATTPPAHTAESEPGLQISVLIEHGNQDLEIEYAGAGFWEALLLSAALPQSAGRIAVLDEPARNLHPTLQRQLLGELRRAPGQFIVTTHSPYLVAIQDESDLEATTRFYAREGATRARRFMAAADPGNVRLLKALGGSADARALLFARGVVLVEGGTELGALPEWFAKGEVARRLGTLDALNIAIFSVDGDTGFGTFVTFLHSLEIPWAIVCDGSVYKFGTSKRQIFEQVTGAGVDNRTLQQAVDDAAAGNGATFNALRDVGEGSGIFTLAEDWDSPAESFEAYVDSIAPGLLADAAAVVGRSKPRQGRYAASATACPAGVDALYDKLLHHLDQR
jgi:energy-coupling factor transporter ATP-binding protein EcfA2